MFTEIVTFLTPYFAREGEREALLISAFAGNDTLLSKINYAGAAAEFVPRLVRVLQHHGEVAPQTQALWQLLLTVRRQVGYDKQRQIDSFQAWANTAHMVTLQPGDMVGNPVVQQTNITISGNVQGGMVNIGGQQTVHGNVTITMGDLTQTIQQGNAAPSDKEALQKLVDDLRAALQTVPAEHKEAAELVSTRTTALVQEANQPDTDPESVKSKANRLKQAAENLAGAMPIVTGIAVNIVMQVLKMAGVGG